MVISKQLAQNIVTSIKEILNQEINYIDCSGTIIASTNSQRIATYHEGAKLVVETGKELIIEHDNEWKGARKGINFPVFFNDEIIGIIGITGDKNDVMKYGKILQKMTEILIKEAYVKDLQIQQKRNQKVQVERILNYDKQDAHAEIVSNFDASLPRRIVIGKMSEYAEASRLNRIYDVLHMPIYQDMIDLFTISGDLIILFWLQEVSHTDVMQHLFSQIQEILDQPLFWGIGTISTSFPTIQTSYHQARIASNWCERMKQTFVCEYEHMELGILMSDLSLQTAENFYTPIFHDLSSTQIKEIEDLLNAYEKFNGSIKQCADYLYIHKNTLQYQLMKIKKDTGYDPRNLHDYTILKSALLLYRFHHS